jgi:hypothetical protein
MMLLLASVAYRTSDAVLAIIQDCVEMPAE